MNLRRTIATLSALFLTVMVQGTDLKDPYAEHAAMHFQAASGMAGPVDEKLPPGEENAKASIEKSPRHGEYVDIKLTGDQKPIRTWVVYPERKDKAPIVIVIHEIFGLSDWIRGVADQLAEDGFIAVAPDLICGKGPEGGCTDSISSRDDVVKSVRALSPEDVLTRLNAVRDYGVKIPAGNKKTATVGYCWGGARSYEYATQQLGLNAAVVYYGTSPETPTLAAIKAPVLGLYGEDDARVNATIEPAAAEMKKLKKTYEVEVYKGAGHGFLRAQSGRDGANLRATQAAWPRTIAFLKKHTK
ncbi:MAG: dienelactone hydrolase family protein [Acidobacteria bacterium]|nr:dienelactone hydrolase family protein [Acidobacteriota bacterium]